ncbi:zinc-binding alcohol dehydrogenase family protein [Hyalangium sp.]|uniref:quinone oxidoreductase family protein n=1 Tax=Hyalangium sp. TaxID=2028555 RepID=UPI002D663992|nr:zinc-binding alcohol dehydrogenase family protein [Hyalangium sp.]HYH97672.1 zinc-binding alcohol dehydrogenase family protein [Hyalangium sp.]
MKALQISHHGPISELKVSDIPPPEAGPDEVKIRIEAAGINPSDVFGALGRFPNSLLPRIIGRDFAGSIVEGPSELVGTAVWGSGGDLGISRNGTHAEYLVIPRAAVSRRPKNLSSEQAGAVGVPFITAWSALAHAQLKEGEWVVVAGAAGAVGHAAIQLARARRANVIALVKDEAQAQRLNREELAAVARSDRNDLLEVVKQVTNGRGCDIALNGVGAAVFRPLFDALADRGRMIIYSVKTGREAALDLFSFYERRMSFHSVNTIGIDVVRSAEILQQLTPLFEAGQVRPLDIAERYPVTEAMHAYERVAKGAPGKVVLIPSS